MKIASVRSNAEAILALQQTHGSLDAYLWGFVDGQPVINRFASTSDVPASTPLSDQLSKDMKRRGFSFVGSTIIYAFMQGIGMVNDHVEGCWRSSETVR
jgi:DNA-3-methyladenine glycosylase I